MITFKTYSHSFKLMILAFSFGLSACSIPEPQKKNPEDVAGSTFYFDSVDGDLVSENIQGPFKLPTSKEYKISTCLKDKGYNKPLPSQRFKIEEINQSLVTDAKGCLNWTEKVEYEFLGQSQYVLIPRTITSLSGQTGSIKLQLLMNPWSHGENLSKVFELSRTKLNQYSLRTEDLKNALERPLWADKASFFYQTETKETDGTVFNFDFQTTPQIMLSKMNGDNSFFDLKEGTFQAEFYMIHYLADQGQDKYTKLSSFKTKEPITMKAGVFSLKTQFKISNKPERGQLFLGLKLTPVGGPQGLKTFNGLYALGDAKSFRINSAMIRLQSQASQNPKFDLEKDLNLGGESSSNTNTNSASLNTYRSSGLDLTKINITFSNISSEHTTDKEIHYKIQTCLIDSTDNSPMRAEQIEIQSPNIVYASDKKQKTNESTGCFEWTEKIAFKRYECQHPVAREVHFISKNLNFNKTIGYSGFLVGSRA